MPTGKKLIMIGAGGVFLAAAVYLLGKRWGGNYQNSLRTMLDSQIQEICKGIAELKAKLRGLDPEDINKVNSLLVMVELRMRSLVEQLEQQQDFLSLWGKLVILHCVLSELRLYDYDIMKLKASAPPFNVIEGARHRYDLLKSLSILCNLLESEIQLLHDNFVEASTPKARDINYFYLRKGWIVIDFMKYIKERVVQSFSSRDDIEQKDLLAKSAEFDQIIQQNDNLIKQVQQTINTNLAMEKLYDELAAQVEKCISSQGESASGEQEIASEADSKTQSSDAKVQEQLRVTLNEQIQEICKIISTLETKIQQSKSELSIVNQEDSQPTEQALTIFETMNPLPFASERERLFFFGIKMILFSKVSKYSYIQKVFKDGSLDNPANFLKILNNINIFKQDFKKYWLRCFNELSDSSDQAKELRAFMYYFDAEIASHVPSVSREIVTKIKKAIDYKISDERLLNKINDLDNYFKEMDAHLQARRASNPRKMKAMKNLYDELNAQVERCIKTAR